MSLPSPPASKSGSAPSLFKGAPSQSKLTPDANEKLSMLADISTDVTQQDEDIASEPQFHKSSVVKPTHSLSSRFGWLLLGSGLLVGAALLWLQYKQHAKEVVPSLVSKSAQPSKPDSIAAGAVVPPATAVSADAATLTRNGIKSAETAKIETIPGVAIVDAVADKSGKVSATNQASTAKEASVSTNADGNTAKDNKPDIPSNTKTASASNTVAKSQAKKAAHSKPVQVAKNSQDQRFITLMTRGSSGPAVTKPTRETSYSSNRASGSNADSDEQLFAAIMAHTAIGDARKTSLYGDAVSDTTIADLVNRCKRSVEGSESAACQQRICQGYWGKAQACPSRLAPKTGRG